MASANDIAALMASLSAKTAVIEAQEETIRQLREQLKGRTLHVSAVEAVEAVKKPAQHVVPKHAKVADYELAAGPKAVTMATFKHYAAGPVKKTGFFYQAVAYLRTVCEHGVDEHRRAMDALISYHGEGSTVALRSSQVEPTKYVVSFDTWETLFAAAGFVPGPSADYAPVNTLAKMPAKSASRSASKSESTVSEASVSRSFKVVPRSAAA